MCSSRSLALDRPRQSALRYPAVLSNRASTYSVRRQPAPIHAPLRSHTTSAIVPPTISHSARGTQIPITHAAPPTYPFPRFPPLEVCGRRPHCPRHHLHGAGIRKPSQQQTHAPRQIAPYGQPADAGEHGLFGQPRFPKALNRQLRVRLPASGDPRGYCKVGIDLKQTRRRLARLSVTSEVGKSGREAAISYRKGGVLTLGFLPCDDGLVKATKLNQGHPQPTKRQV
jgi:hypothetical protein